MKIKDILKNLAVQIFSNGVSRRQAIAPLSSSDASDMLKK
jgi:hypothetical protein